jgi:hypothetical protein
VENTTLRRCAYEQQISALTLGEVSPRSRDGDSDRQRTTIVLGDVEGASEGAGDESANGKDRRESDHRGGMGISGGRGRGCSSRRERRVPLPNTACFYSGSSDTKESG